MPNGASPEELLAVPTAPQPGTISGPAPYMLAAEAPPGTLPPAGPPALPPPRTAAERVTTALGGPEALQIPEEWQAGPAPEMAVPREVLRTATGGEVLPSQLPRVTAAPLGAEPYAGRRPWEVGPPARIGTTTVETAEQSATSAHVQQVLGEPGVQMLAQLRAQGVPEATIRQRLGLPPLHRGPAAAGGMGMARPEPPLPEELQRPYETLYPEDYESRVAAAAVAGDITNEQAREMMRGFEAWQRSPLGVRAAEGRRQMDVAEQAGELAQQQIAAEQQAAQAQKALLDQQRAQQEAEANAQRAWQEDYDREMADQTARYERAIEEAKRARIDPTRASVPIVDALAIALGQFAAIMTGTPNAAMQLINQRHDRDIAAQDREIKTLEGNVAARHNRLGLLRQRFGDRQQAMQAEKRLQLEQVSTELQRIASTSKIETNRIGAQKLGLALENQIAEMRAQEQMQHAIASEELANMRHQQRLAAANQLALQRQQAERVAEMQRTGMGPWQTKEADKMQERYVPGFGFVASAQAARDVRDNLSKFDTTIRAFEGLLKIAEVPGAATSPEYRARAQSLLSQADLGLAVANQLGAISASDADFVQKQRGNPTALTDIGAKTRLEQTLGDLKANRAKALARHHFVPGEMATTMQESKRGEVAPQISYRLSVPGAQAPQAAPPGSITETELQP